VVIDDRLSTPVRAGETFVFQHLTPGKNELRVDMYGDVLAERTVSVADGEIVTLDPIVLDAKVFKTPAVLHAE
jgi:hypothetical protein